MAAQSRIAELAAQITSNTGKVSEYLHANGLAQPTFEAHGPRDMALKDADAEAARVTALSAAAELQDLLQGPLSCLQPPMNTTALEATYRWKIAQHVPLESDISYADLAAKVGLPEPVLRRIVRYGICHHRMFLEPRSGFVAHSVASLMLADDEEAYACLGMMYDEGVQGCVRTCDAMAKFNHSDEPNQTGYALAHAPGKTMWEYYEQDNPERGKRFATAMRGYTGRTGFQLSSIVDGYPWSSSPEGTKIVDCGGSDGHVCIAIARKQPHLTFTVQDLPPVIAKAKEAAAELPDDIKSRISFEPHSFLEPQPVEADVYLFRWIFHDWPESYVLKILRNLMPKLKTGSKIIVNEQIMPLPGVIPMFHERSLRFVDMCMLSFFNASERTLEDWERIFAALDPRFTLKSWLPEGETFWIVEATWTG